MAQDPKPQQSSKAKEVPIDPEMDAVFKNAYLQVLRHERAQVKNDTLTNNLQTVREQEQHDAKLKSCSEG
jgi:hypothetical protein